MFGLHYLTKWIPSRKMLLALIVVLAAYNLYDNRINSRTEPSPIVSTTNGKIQGLISKSRDGKEYYEFLGIPYAKPPIGELRFEVPQPPESWEGIKPTNQFGSECVQLSAFFKGSSPTGSEDCLFLNVFSPKVGFNGFSENKLPVIVYIHGGYFMMGSANTHGADYFMDEYIVLVTLNYRLNSLGFLSTGDELIRGNMGLKDQTLALKWVQANIAKFGGDPTKVTLAGVSAGAISVNFHMMSSMSKGLFHAAISQSGTALKVWGTQVAPKEQAEYLFERLNCTKATMKESVRCLKGLKAEKIVETHTDYANPILTHVHRYAPVIETHLKSSKDTFITEDPKLILTSGRGNNVPWMVGVDSAEGLLYTAGIMHKPDLVDQFESNFETIFSQIFVYDKNNKKITSNLRKFYFDVDGEEKAKFHEKFTNYTNLVSDRFYNEGTRGPAALQAKFSPVYLYYNNYDAEFTIFDFLSLPQRFPIIIEIIWKLGKNWFQKNILKETPVRFGACHGDELSLLFPFPMAYVGPTSPDFEMSRALVKVFAQFAYDDKNMKFFGSHWKSISANLSELKYMQFSNSVQGNQLIDEPFKERMEFWESLKLPN